jgi:DNA-binding PadR family transcriptional regulator
VTYQNARGPRSTRWGSDPALLILSSLAEEPRHGYAIVADVEQMSGVHLGPGTLYGALARLEEQGLIEPLPARDRRRPYRITAAGAAALEQQLSTLVRVASQGLSRLQAAHAGR